jgi:putative SOS response-associated peptidase YedK
MRAQVQHRPSTNILIVREDKEHGRLAGITELWNGPDGPLHTVCLITTEPNDLMREIHDRMPLIVPPEATAPGPTDESGRDGAKGVYPPLPPQRMEAYPLSRAVSNARNDEEKLIERQ